MSALQAYVDGVVIPASQLAQRDPLFAYKAGDQTLNNVGALTNDSALFVNLAANATYRLSLLALQNSGATPGFKFAFTLPTGATWNFGYFDCGSSGANRQFGVVGVGGTGGVTGAGADSVVKIEATIVTAGTAGPAQFQWCQSTANASNTIVRAGSSLLATQVA